MCVQCFCAYVSVCMWFSPCVSERNDRRDEESVNTEIVRLEENKITPQQSDSWVCRQGEINVGHFFPSSYECPMSVLKVCVHVCKRGENPQACQSCQPVSDYGTQGDSYSCPAMDSREETWDMNNLFWTKKPACHPA